MKKPSKSELPLTFDHRPQPSSSNGRSWSAALYDVFTVDTRSLALYRVVLAAIVVLDLCNRIPDLRAHYTDEGYFPRKLMLSSWQMPGYFSIHFMNGSEFFQLILFLANYFIAIALAVGWRTRLMTFLCWYMMYSLHARNLVILHSGGMLRAQLRMLSFTDVYLRMMFLWACFMPLGAEWSIDKIRSGRSQPGAPSASGPEQYRHFSIGGSVGSILQLVYVYLFSTLEKHNRAYQVWYVEGSGTFWALNSLPYMRTMIGDWAATVDPSILSVMTFGVLIWEVVGPLLYLMPWRYQYCRLLGIAGQFALHFGFALCLKLETFVWIGCTASFFLIPPMVWDSIIPALRRKFFQPSATAVKHEIKISFTENAVPLAQSIETFLLLPNVKWTESLGDPEKVYEGALGSTPSLTVTCDEQNLVAHNEQALSYLFANSPIAWPLAPLFRTQAGQAAGFFYFELMRARVYDVNSPPSSPRYKRASRASYLPSKERKALCDMISYVLSPTLWANVIGGLLVLYVLAWNTTNVKLPPTLPVSLQPYASFLMLDQSWHMFSPPPRHAYFHNIELNLRDGTKLELIKGGGLYRWEGVPHHTGPPLPLYENYGTHRHFKVWEVYTFASTNTENRLEFGRWICREWNARHTDGKVLQNHKTWLVTYPAETPREQVEAAYKRELLWDHNCF